MKKRNVCYLSIIIFLTYNCTFNKEITTYNDLSEEMGGGKIHIIDRDTVIYITDNYIFSDSSISITGIRKKLGVESKFSGDLLFKNILSLQSKKAYFIPSLAFVGLSLFTILDGGPMLTARLGIEPYIQMKSSGGSCPYIYSWDGEKYFLEGEAFGTALGKALETETCLVLDNVIAENNKIKLKITNERPETHFFNNIKLTATETNVNQIVYSDNKNNLKAVQKKKNIFKAIDINNIDITNSVKEEEGVFWESDLSSATLNLNFEDQIFVELNDVADIDSLSLLISAINTQIFDVIFSYLQMILGKDYVNFIKVTETDQELTDKLRDALVRSSLKIDLWDGQSWKYIDLVYPEANFVKFKKLVRIPVIKNEENILKLRLRCLSDVWKIDALKYDDSPQETLIYHQPELLSYVSDVNNSDSDIIKRDDNYTKLLPGQSMFLEYSNVEIPSESKITYAITVGGYLYEWIIDKRINYETNFDFISLETPKVKLVKEMLNKLDYILPLIYNKWKVAKDKYVLLEEPSKIKQEYEVQ